MAANDFKVLGRTFRTSSDYKAALKDKVFIDQLKKEYDFPNPDKIQQLKQRLQREESRFQTLVGKDFIDDVCELAKGQGTNIKKKVSISDYDASMQKKIRMELKKRENRRRFVVLGCILLASFCFFYIGIYYYQDLRANKQNEQLLNLKDNQSMIPSDNSDDVLIHYDSDEIDPNDLKILEEYKNLYNKNKKLIGWIKIDDTNIDYPVMQTSDNEYYLRRNIDQEYDRNGSIFLDKDCDVVNRSTNLIIYGHHMRSGNMFGKLDLYSDEKYYEEHKYIQFDTIYEKGIYEVMYVFRSKIYAEDEIVFKYYQFIDANSEKEFNSYMQEMAEMSLYDTGVTAQFGDELLTLSTCDYYTDYGRFVIVAKKIQ